MLKRLLAANGTELDGSDEAVQALNDWFRRELEPLRTTRASRDHSGAI